MIRERRGETCAPHAAKSVEAAKEGGINRVPKFRMAAVMETLACVLYQVHGQ